MADPTPTPPVPPTPAANLVTEIEDFAQSWIQRRFATTLPHWALVLITAGIGLAGAALSAAIQKWLGSAPPAAQVVEKRVEVPIYYEDVVADGDHSFGWQRDADAVAANLDPTQTLHFATTPAGRAALGDEDVFLWQAVRKVNNRGPPWYPNIDQKSVGCCVGCGFKHSSDVCQAVQIANGHPAQWKPLSVEVIYAGSRVDIGGGRLRGDGSNGSWAAKYISTVGVAPMEKIGHTDLTAFSPTRARQWGAKGVPAEVAAVAKQHPVKDCALVKNWADVKRAVMQGYPVAVASDVGFDNADGTVGTRDKDGFCSSRGVWPHCMAIIGVRGGGRPGGFILNSWGDSAHAGAVWPADMPVAGFWADADVIDRMVRQGDSFALSDLVGFPTRKPLDWAARPVVRPQGMFALNPLRGEPCEVSYSLAP